MNRFRCHYFDMGDNAEPQAELDSLRAQKQVSDAKVTPLEAEKAEWAGKPKRLKLPDVKEYDGKQPLAPFLESCDQFLEGHPDSEKIKYLVSRCTGQSQGHLRNQRDLNKQAGKDFTFEDAKEALKGLYFTEDPKTGSHRLVVLDGIKQGNSSVKQYIQHLCSHVSRLDSSDEDKRAWLLRGLSDEDFRAICKVTYHPEGDKASVLSLSQHILKLDPLYDSGRTKPVGGSGHGASVQGKGKRMVGGG